jgi:hypothetical protein
MLGRALQVMLTLNFCSNKAKNLGRVVLVSHSNQLYSFQCSCFRHQTHSTWPSLHFISPNFFWEQGMRFMAAVIYGLSCLHSCKPRVTNNAVMIVVSLCPQLAICMAALSVQEAAAPSSQYLLLHFSISNFPL